MNAFEDFYRKCPQLNLTGFSFDIWKKAKERDQIIWKAALEWVLNLNTDKEHIKCSDGVIIEDVRSRFHILKSKIIREVDSEKTNTNNS